MNVLTSAGRSAIAEAFSSRSSSYLRAGYVIRPWSSSRIALQDQSHAGDKGKQREVAMEGAGAVDKVSDTGNDSSDAMHTDGVVAASKRDGPPDTSTSQDSDVASAQQPKHIETVEDILGEYFDRPLSSASAPNPTISPSKSSETTPNDKTSRNTDFKPVKDYVPGFLSRPRFAASGRRNREQMSPAEQEVFNNLIKDFAILYGQDDPHRPKFPLPSGTPVADALRSRDDDNGPSEDSARLPTMAKRTASPVMPLSDATFDVDAQLDKLKEEIAALPTDVDILAWMTRRVFPASSKDETVVFPPTYPHILTYLITLFRDRFANPELSLAIFSHARSHSVESYLAGCSTSAYNEMIKTRWKCFRDLGGVEEGVKEMLHHGVGWDSTTTNMISTIVEEIGSQLLSGEDGARTARLQFGEDINSRLASLENEVERYVAHAEKKHRVAMSRRAEDRRLARDYRAMQGGSRDTRYQRVQSGEQ